MALLGVPLCVHGSCPTWRFLLEKTFTLCVFWTPSPCSSFHPRRRCFTSRPQRPKVLKVSRSEPSSSLWVPVWLNIHVVGKSSQRRPAGGLEHTYAVKASSSSLTSAPQQDTSFFESSEQAGEHFSAQKSCSNYSTICCLAPLTIIPDPPPCRDMLCPVLRFALWHMSFICTHTFKCMCVCPWQMGVLFQESVQKCAGVCWLVPGNKSGHPLLQHTYRSRGELERVKEKSFVFL